jgi:hypothetical protein
MDIREEYIKEYRERQEKYVYYILAIPIAAIGFSVNITMDRKWSQIDFVLATAIFLWLISVLYGILTIQRLVGSIASNIDIIDIRSGIHPLTGNHPQKIQVGLETMQNELIKLSSKSGRFMNLQKMSLYLGVIMFLLWRLLDMLPAQTVDNIVHWISIKP